MIVSQAESSANVDPVDVFFKQPVVMCNLHFLLQLHLTSCGIQAAVADADDAADAADVADAADAEDAADAADVADAAAPAVS